MEGFNVVGREVQETVMYAEVELVACILQYEIFFAQSLTAIAESGRPRAPVLGITEEILIPDLSTCHQIRRGDSTTAQLEQHIAINGLNHHIQIHTQVQPYQQGPENEIEELKHWEPSIWEFKLNPNYVNRIGSSTYEFVFALPDYIDVNPDGFGRNDNEPMEESKEPAEPEIVIDTKDASIVQGESEKAIVDYADAYTDIPTTGSSKVVAAGMLAAVSSAIAGLIITKKKKA